ncbi:MAG: hypothetical protein J0H63_03200, partial [Rhizobiales bacterium]|nr:hypothetical protein [Hyphomicrobiales bacterium]
MSNTTTQRLKDHLNGNQPTRERLCAAVMSIDKRFANVRPRHPEGGHDGGADIDAVFLPGRIAVGAVGFVNNANDSKEQKKKISEKFEDDANAALGQVEKPAVFVFFTNINLTQGEHGTLKKKAKKLGFEEVDIYDRERMRLALDNVDGLAARFQFLDIPMSAAEQATFFAKWGDDVQSLVATGFQRVERTLNRMLFLQESEDALSELTVVYELHRAYTQTELGHFRALCLLTLREPKHNIFMLLFGTTNGSDRFETGRDGQIPQRDGVSGPQWTRLLRPLQTGSEEVSSEQGSSVSTADGKIWAQNGRSHGALDYPMSMLRARYGHAGSLIRMGPHLRLRDLDGAMMIHYLNASLATKLKKIHVYADAYKLAEFGEGRFSIDDQTFTPNIPIEFPPEELQDPWVKIRGGRFSSAQHLDFYDE